MNISSGVEVSDDLQIARFEDFVKGIVNLVRCRLMGDIAVPEFIQPELKRTKFYYIFIGHIVYSDSGKIGVATAGTKAGELGEGYADIIVLLGRGILPNLKLGFFYRLLAVLLFHSI